MIKKAQVSIKIPEHFLFGHFDEVAAVTLQCDKRHFGAVVHTGENAVVAETAADQQPRTAAVKSLTEFGEQPLTGSQHADLFVQAEMTAVGVTAYHKVKFKTAVAALFETFGEVGKHDFCAV